MIGQMAIVIALPGFNGLGRSVTPIFSFQKQILFTFISMLSKNEQKFNVGTEVKIISRFLSAGHRILPSYGCKTRETVVAKGELVLQGTSPVDEIHLVGPLKQYVAEKISLQGYNFNIFRLTDTSLIRYRS